ncbi:sugar phosphate isomerase/epimerase family protein [Consotaella aegiceratis]|uniref:sugar phosphate isomerase/epimerase family protein n=1 Tax=Consotaella aegiceratis TaxID=3097961 RepID=UPI002F3F3E4E
MIRLGGHGLPVGSDDPAAFAAAHREFGYRAAYCPSCAIGDTDRQRAISTAFAEADVTLAEIGIWRNLITPDERTRAENVAYACETLALADAIGVGCAVSYIGSFAAGTNYAPHPKNLGDEAFDATVETARYIIDAVEPQRTRFALEMMQYALPDSVDCTLALIKAVDRPAFAAHVDPVNLVMTPRTYFDTASLIRECFQKLGPHIVSCHAKDIVLHDRAALHFDEVIIGDGILDYPVFLAELEKLDVDVPLMLEHLEGSEYARARDRLVAIAAPFGIRFS